jgi:pimeloyl-ACP methyl ester carboxylesterase
LLLLAALVLLCAACGQTAAERHPTRHVRTRTVPGEPGLEYRVRGRYLYLLCEGIGSPTVVFESGLADDHRAWLQVAPELANSTDVCTYDRSGLEYSQLAPKRASAREKVHDLHALLRAARARPPYILVGHSYGGMLVHLYASDYPRDVAGMVLVDSSHPDEQKRLLAALPPRRPREDARTRQIRSALHRTTFPNPEGVDWGLSTDEVRRAGSIRDAPLVVLTAGDDEAGLPPALVRPFRRVRLALQDDLAQLSSDSVHVVATYSEHAIQSNLGQPELVIRAIRAVLHAVRTQGELPACRELFHGPGARCVG